MLTMRPRRLPQFYVVLIRFFRNLAILVTICSIRTIRFNLTCFAQISQQISQEISSEGQISADDELSVEDLMKKLKSI